jgi:hypothetical protein
VKHNFENQLLNRKPWLFHGFPLFVESRVCIEPRDPPSPGASSTCGLGINAMGSATARGAGDFVGVAALAGCGPMLIHQHAGTPIMANYQGRCKGLVLDSQFPNRNLLIPSHLSLYLYHSISMVGYTKDPQSVIQRVRFWLEKNDQRVE